MTQLHVLAGATSYTLDTSKMRAEPSCESHHMAQDCGCLKVDFPEYQKWIYSLYSIPMGYGVIQKFLRKFHHGASPETLVSPGTVWVRKSDGNPMASWSTLRS